jgi:hypothetical protein
MNDGSVVELLRALPRRSGRVNREPVDQGRARGPEAAPTMEGDAGAALGARVDAEIRSALLGELRLMGRPRAPGGLGRRDEAASPAGVAA